MQTLEKLTLRTKVFIYTLLAIVGGAILYFIISLFLIKPAFNEFETSYLEERSKQIFSTLQNEIAHLDIFIKDWANWDDSYNFVIKPSKPFIESNLLPLAFEDANLHLIAYVDTKGKIVWANLYDNERTKLLSLENLPSVLLSHREESLSGIVPTQNEPLIFSSAPVYKSDASGEAVGTMLMGRYLNDDLINTLSEQLQSPLKISLDPESYPAQISVPNYKVRIISVQTRS